MGEQVAEQVEIPEGYRQYANGAIASIEHGTIVKAPTNPPINASNARELALRRWEKAQSIARQSIAQVNGTASSLAAWGNLVGFRYQMAMSADNKRGTEDARFVGQATGYLVQQRNGEQPGGTGLQINVSETGLQRLIGLLEGRMDAGESDNATVVDVDSE